jgi:hypothetical protein
MASVSDRRPCRCSLLTPCRLTTQLRLWK